MGVGRPAPGVGRPWGATSGLSVDDGTPCGVRVLSSGSGPGQVVETGAGGLSAKWLPGASCLAGRPLHLGGIPVPRGWPGRGSGSSGWRAPRPCTGVPRSSMGGRGVGWFRVGRRQPFAGLERARGLILSRSCCTMGGTKHPGGAGRTSSDCPRDHEFSVPDGPHRAGRTRSEAWMGGGGVPGGEVGGWVFRDLRVRSGGWVGRGVSCCLFRYLRGGLRRCDAW